MKKVLEKINFKPQMGGLSRREFFLLVFMIIAVEGYLLYAYVLRPTYDSYMVSMNELIEKQNTLNGLMADYAKKDQMEEEILRIEAQLDEIHKQLPSFLSQEEAAMTVVDLSGTSGLDAKVLNFTNASTIPLKAIPADSSDTDKVYSAAPVPMFIEQLVNINFAGEYSNIYSLLKSVEASERKMAAKAISIATDSDGKLSGSMILSFPSFWDDSVGQSPFIMEPAPVFTGKNSPFDRYSGYSSSISNDSSEEGGSKTVTPDFNLRVNSYLNNSAKIFMSNAFNTGSEARYDANDVTRAKMTINGGNGTYTYSYSLGTYTIVENEQTEIKEGKIRIEVLVQARRSSDDKVGLILDVTNNTNVPVEITVKGDESENPRFVVGTTTGNVVKK